MSLFWKKLSSHIYISEKKSAPQFKTSKVRLTMLLSGNVSGDVKFKPLLIYHSENPRALKECIKAQLPVVCCSNPKSWITQSVMQDYIINYFSTYVMRYSQQNNFTNKSLLLVDSAPGYAQHMNDRCNDV